MVGGLQFGIYPGSVAGDDHGGLASGPPDDDEAIASALTELHGRAGRPFLVRTYLSFTDDTEPAAAHPTLTPANAERLTGQGRSLDLVAQYQSPSGDVDGYCTFLEALVDQFGTVTTTLQITEEPNVSGMATLDGDYPRVREALVAGVTAAKRRARLRGLDHLQVGFNTTPLFGPAQDFVVDLTRAGGHSFVADLDYVGLDFFPDVFSPIPTETLAAAVTGLLGHHRSNVLTPAGLDDHAIRISEHGWPTGPGRPPERQAEVVDAVVRALHAARDDLGIASYTHFSLRDADSSQDGLFHRFGLMTDNYGPKAAFDRYRSLLDELSPPT